MENSNRPSLVCARGRADFATGQADGQLRPAGTRRKPFMLHHGTTMSRRRCSRRHYPVRYTGQCLGRDLSSHSSRGLWPYPLKCAAADSFSECISTMVAPTSSTQPRPVPTALRSAGRGRPPRVEPRSLPRPGHAPFLPTCCDTWPTSLWTSVTPTQSAFRLLVGCSGFYCAPLGLMKLATQAFDAAQRRCPVRSPQNVARTDRS